MLYVKIYERVCVLLALIILTNNKISPINIYTGLDRSLDRSYSHI